MKVSLPGPFMSPSTADLHHTLDLNGNGNLTYLSRHASISMLITLFYVIALMYHVAFSIASFRIA